MNIARTIRGMAVAIAMRKNVVTAVSYMLLACPQRRSKKVVTTTRSSKK